MLLLLLHNTRTRCIERFLDSDCACGISVSFSISIPMHNGLALIAIITGYPMRHRPWKPDDFSEFIFCIMETNWITAANVQLKYLRASVPADKRQCPPLFSRHFTQRWSAAVTSISNAEYECALCMFDLWMQYVSPLLMRFVPSTKIRYTQTRAFA